MVFRDLKAPRDPKVLPDHKGQWVRVDRWGSLDQQELHERLDRLGQPEGTALMVPKAFKVLRALQALLDQMEQQVRRAHLGWQARRVSLDPKETEVIWEWTCWTLRSHRSTRCSWPRWTYWGS